MAVDLGKAPTVQVFADILAAAADHPSRHPGELAAPPRRHLAILTCIDSRIDPVAIFGLEPGAAHIIRNAGARTTDDALRSLIISTVRMDVDRIAVVHHTQCGVHDTSPEEMQVAVRERTGLDPGDMDFHFFADDAVALREDVDAIAACPYIPDGTVVGGFLFDVASGSLEEIIHPFPVGPR